MSPIEAWVGLVRETPGADAGSEAAVVPGMSIPLMSMLPIVVVESMELWAGGALEWQSDSAGANAHERSHAAASGDTASSSAVTVAAIVRFTRIQI